jgi:hypothetical protein
VDVMIGCINLQISVIRQLVQRSPDMRGCGELAKIGHPGPQGSHYPGWLRKLIIACSQKYLYPVLSAKLSFRFN